MDIRSPAPPHRIAIAAFLPLVPLAIVASLATGSAADADNREPRGVYMPDGQLQSHLISVYVTEPLTETSKPRLRLTAGHSVTDRELHEGRLLRPAFIVPRQQWWEDRLGTKSSATGTLLLFDLSKKRLVPWYKAMSRFRPIVEWNCNGSQCADIAVGPREVNLGRTTSAWIWTVLVVLLVLGALAVLTGRSKGARPTLKWLCVEDGHYSLARTQILIWTVAIGVMVLFYGLVRLSVPTIPGTLLALMTMSLVTGA